MVKRDTIASPIELQVMAFSVKERKGREIGKRIGEETGQVPKWSTLYLTIDRLADRGWVRIRPGEVNGRQVRWVKLSRSGSAVLNRSRRYYQELSVLGVDPEFEH